MTCLRCQKEKKNFPHPRNKSTCGDCLHDLHENWRQMEQHEPPIVRGL